MNRLIFFFLLTALLFVTPAAQAQQTPVKDSTELVKNDTATAPALSADSAMAAIDAELGGMEETGAEEGGGLHKQLKRKFIEGSAGFMSLVALALVLGLAFCIERIIYLKSIAANSCMTSMPVWNRTM